MTRSASTGKRNLLTNAAANWLGFAVQVVVTFLLSPVLVRALGTGRYGVWSLVESILAYLILLDFGVGASVVRYVSKYEAAHDYEQVNRVFSTSMCIFGAAGLLAQLLAVLIAFVGLPLYAQIPADLLPEARWLLILLGTNLGLGLPLSIFCAVLSGLGRYPAQNAIRTTGLVIRSLLLLAVARSGGGLVPLAVVITVSTVCEHVALAALAWRYLPELRFSFALADRSTLKTIRGYTTDAFVAMIAGRISFQTDSLVIGAFYPPALITFFAIPARLVEYAKDTFRTITTGLMPAVSVLETLGDNAGIRRVLMVGTRSILWLVLPMQAGLMILGKPFLALWMHNTPEIAENSYPTLLILATPLALALPQVVAARILYGMGRLRWFARAAMAEALANLVLSLALVQPLGIEGVALGTAIPNVIGSSALIFYICRTLDVGVGRYLRYTFLAPLATVVPLAAGWLAATRWLDLTSWFALVGVGAAGLSGYLLAGALVEFGPRKVLQTVQTLAPRAAARGPNPEQSREINSGAASSATGEAEPELELDLKP
jgi:O-antigen/teichoic acid export membrane protein